MNDPSPPDETDAIIWITHADLVPDEISTFLGVKPTRVHARGSGPFAQWILSSRKNLETASPNKHLNWILKQMSGCRSQLHELKAKGYSVELKCKIYASTDTTALIIEPELLKSISDLGLLFICEINCNFGSAP